MAKKITIEQFDKEIEDLLNQLTQPAGTSLAEKLRGLAAGLMRKGGINE